MLRVDLNKRSIDIMIDDAELERRRGEAPPAYSRKPNPLAGNLPGGGRASVRRCGA